jgi:hypothetical protein
MGVLEDGDGRCPVVWKVGRPVAVKAEQLFDETVTTGSSESEAAADRVTAGRTERSTTTGSVSPVVGYAEIGFPVLGPVQVFPVHQWPHTTHHNIDAGSGVTVPAGSFVVEFGGHLWMRDGG